MTGRDWMWMKRLLLLAWMLVCPTLVLADGRTLARDVTAQFHLLESEVAMFMYDDSNPAFARQVKEMLAAMAPQVEAALEDLAKLDATAGTESRDGWRVMHDALLGGGDYGEGLLVTGYDAKVHGDYDESKQRIVAALEKQYQPGDAKSSVEDRAYLLAAKAVSTYIRASGNPFGTYTTSYNDEADPVKLVARMDALIPELTAKYRGDKEKSTRIARLSAKWQFIRTAILKIGKQSTPLIVYKHGGDIVRELGTLKP